MKKKLLKLFIATTLVCTMSMGISACKRPVEDSSSDSVSVESSEQSLKIDFTALTLDVYDEVQLSVEGAKGEVVWSSSNVSVAVVTQGGMVTALSAGNVEITAKAGGETVSCRITVRYGGVVPMLEFDNNDFAIYETTSLSIGAKVSFKGEILPCEIKYTTANGSIAIVDNNGVVTGVAAGETVITVTAVINANLTLSDSIRVTVRSITN